MQIQGRVLEQQTNIADALRVTFLTLDTDQVTLADCKYSN